MIVTNCPRSWEAEASRDGRLSKGARASFEQHCAACTLCRHTADSLDALAEELRAAAPPVDEVASRRLRQRVLRSANEWAAAGVAPRPGRWKLGAAAAAALALGILSNTLWQDRPAELDADLVARAEPGAIWSRRPSKGMDEITLLDGALSVEVRHSSSPSGSSRMTPPLTLPPRVLVRVPDGQILDRGTRFRVVVQRERTQQIEVSEGAVLFQRFGLPDVQVESGSTWRVQEEPAAADAAPLQTAGGSASAIGAPEPVMEAPGRALRVVGPAPRPEAKSVGEHVGHLPDPTGDAVSGAEDAAYLQWISLLRSGRRAAARAAGLDYLRRFPNAFRRAEVQAVVAPLESSPSTPQAPPQQ